MRNNVNRIRRIYRAGMAQSVEQLIRNQQVGGSSPPTSSKKYDYPFGWSYFFVT